MNSEVRRPLIRPAHAGHHLPQGEKENQRNTHSPFLITVTARSMTLASKEIYLPSRHRSTVMVSPGKTGEENRT